MGITKALSLHSVILTPTPLKYRNCVYYGLRFYNAEIIINAKALLKI